MIRKLRALLAVLFLAALLVVLTACSRGTGGKAYAYANTSTETIRATAPGSIIFTANGEDIVRRGFVDRRGWSITFENLYVHIVEPTAYLPEGDRQVVLEGSHWVDLAEGESDAKPIVVGTVQEVPPANYQCLRFAIERVADGPYAGSSMVMSGSAERDGIRVPFTIRLDEEMVFDGREGYVGEELKGLLQPGSTTEVEMTFHLDHIFGDYEADEEDHINSGSVGFDFFYAFADQGIVGVRQEDLREAEGYDTLVRALWSLGHLGEGHCEVSQQSSLVR